MKGSNDRAALVSLTFAIESQRFLRQCRMSPASKAGIFLLDELSSANPLKSSQTLEAYTTDSNQCAADDPLPSATEAEDRVRTREMT